MAVSSSSLELTISVAGFSHCPSRPSPGDDQGVRDLDINQKAEEEDDQWIRIGASVDEEDSNPTPPRKKLRLTKEQSLLLEESFRLNHTLNPKQKQELAIRLKLRPRQVEVWFQNRRARSKLKQTEMECEYLKRWLGWLREQNRRLHREVEELRDVPHSSHPLPASSLSMCPRCERVTEPIPGVGPPPTALSRTPDL